MLRLAGGWADMMANRRADRSIGPTGEMTMTKLKKSWRPMVAAAALLLVAACTGQNHQMPAGPGNASIDVPAVTTIA
jgi:hypothetical protein